MHYRKNEPAVVGEVIDGEAIVINLETGNYYSMEGSGAYIWDRVTNGADLESIGAALAEIAGADVDVAAVVRQFVELLASEDLIRPEEHVAASSQPARPPAIFAPPKLNVFTDMQALLLLDPIHQVDSTGWPRPSSEQ